MEKEAVFNELLELILSANLRQWHFNLLFDRMKPHLEKIADMLCIAKMSVHFWSDPDIYDLEGADEFMENVYSENVAPFEKAITFMSGKMGKVSINTIFYPVNGHEWTDEEHHTLAAISRFISSELSRANMIRCQEKVQYIDAMTGLANTAGVEFFGSFIDKNYSITNYTGCLVNLKNFKYINQQLGVQAADEIICNFAKMLYKYLDRHEEFVARVGGDNFFVMVKNERLTEFLNIMQTLEIPFTQGDMSVCVHVGTWIGTYPAKEGDSVLSVYPKASFAVEQAKASKSSVSCFDENKMDYYMREKTVSQMLPDAIIEKEFAPFYQPKVSVSGKSVCGCEALIRWNHNGVMISPGAFIGVAEESGIISNMDLYMLDAVCADIRGWLDKGIEPVRVSVNYSQQDFYKETITEDTIEIIDKYGIDGKYLEIEITESLLLEKSESLNNFIEAMHERGITVSLDDFGTGYSSFNMFKNLNVDSIKLDRSFFVDIENDPKGRIILQSVIDMIRQMDMIAVAEGIETHEQLSLILRAGVDIVQGFIFDKPMCRDEFTAHLINPRYEA